VLSGGNRSEGTALAEITVGSSLGNALTTLLEAEDIVPGTGPYYVYAYWRPDGRPCYIGKGKGDRWNVHDRRCTNKHLWAIIQQAEGSVRKEKLFENLSQEAAVAIEVALIAKIGREKYGGPLVNQTDGGDGTHGNNNPKSPEHRAKIGAAHRGMKRSAETRRKISLAAQGRKCSPEECEARRQRALGRKRGPPSAETRAKMSASLTGRVLSAETRAKMSASAPKKKTAEHAAAISAGLKGRTFTEEHIENMRKAAILNSPQQSKKLVAYHASLSPEQQAERGRRISAGMRAG
jgi:hypothetical protein